MTDRNNKILFAVVLAICIIALPFGVRYIANKVKTERTEIASIRQSAVSSKATADRAKSEYIVTKDRNIQKEKEVAKDAVQNLCKMYSDDGDALIGWAELVARARSYNGQWRNSTD